MIFAEGLRVDTWVEQGSEVPPFYDPMLAKLIVKADSREAARRQLGDALARTSLHGIESNLDYLRQILNDQVFVNAQHHTRYLDGFEFEPLTIDVISPGTQTMVQDYPGRSGYWNIGVPPSGPMDHLALRLANRALGNPQGAAALELTVTGPALRFNVDTVIALAGARMKALLDGEDVAYWQPVAVKAGSTLKLGSIEGSGNRSYLAVKGGFNVPDYMGSKATFTLGQFGGHGGRTLQVPGDRPGRQLAGAERRLCRCRLQVQQVVGRRGVPSGGRPSRPRDPARRLRRRRRHLHPRTRRHLHLHRHQHRTRLGRGHQDRRRDQHRLGVRVHDQPEAGRRTRHQDRHRRHPDHRHPEHHHHHHR